MILKIKRQVPPKRLHSSTK